MKNFIFISILTLAFNQGFAQLKADNFLFLDSTNYKIKATNGSNGLKGFIILDSKFKYEKSLHFISYKSYGPGYCCNYYEVKQIPKGWNIITVEDIVAHMEDKSNAFRFNTKKLFFVEYDKDRRTYKAYQADIIGWPRTDWHLNLPGDAYKGLMLQGLQDSNYYKDNILNSMETKTYNGDTYTLAKYYNQISGQVSSLTLNCQ